MRVSGLGAFAIWAVVALLAVAGFAAFSPEPEAPSPSITAGEEIAAGRGEAAGRVAAAAFGDRTSTTFHVVELDDDDLALLKEARADLVTVTTEGGNTVGPCRASWYGPRFAGRSTANGETFDPSQLTAAMHGVSFGTMVTVTRVDTGAAVTVRINDRGPFVWNGDTGGWERHPTRCIDLSEAAMRNLDGVGLGLVKVTLSW